MLNYTYDQEKNKERHSANLTAEQRRLIFRASHRGIKEMDIILGNYVNNHIKDFQSNDIKALEHLLSFEDRDLYSWFIGETEIPEELNTPLLQKILQFQINTSKNIQI